MGNFLDFLSKLSESKLEIGEKPIIINNYYITIDNRVIKLTENEFNKYVQEKHLRIGGKTKLLEAKGGDR